MSDRTIIEVAGELSRLVTDSLLLFTFLDNRISSSVSGCLSIADCDAQLSRELLLRRPESELILRGRAVR